MIREGHETTTMFIGTEVEHTPAFGLRTLFVVGLQKVTDILAVLNEKKIQHIYFGANQSFPFTLTSIEWQEWYHMISVFLDKDYLCTLDIDVSQVKDLTETKLVEQHNFIPMISVKLPYIQQLGYNATIKLDDIDFKATNPGVWCHSLHTLKNREVFTDWSKYTQDEVIK